MSNTAIEYEAIINACKSLFIKKTRDYGKTWRDMRISPLTDLILMKLMRVKQIEDDQGRL